ncbi:hypothetical protein Salat_0487900 [Sesamum alatum]|uniref:Uncharacterized protein n=1 Tax=Sesamum alatum TaxID=300844 RepID=A0AAE2D0U6_9LAMI|nr:hypothetical protein Salat_0487900 [Sesamum alatum]
MAGDDFYWQHKMFYCEHWTPEIEDTFIQSLLAHHRKGTFHHDRVNCHPVLCVLFDINARLVVVEWDPKKNMISADKYVWEQIAKAKTIGKCYVKAPEPQWSALWILFGEWPSDDSDEDESVYFDRAGTCLDESGSILKHHRLMTPMETHRLAMITMTIRHPATSGYATPPPQSPNKDMATPSSMASNDPDIEENTSSPYIPKYLRRRQPKKPKF